MLLTEQKWTIYTPNESCLINSILAFPSGLIPISLYENTEITLKIKQKKILPSRNMFTHHPWYLHTLTLKIILYIPLSYDNIPLRDEFLSPSKIYFHSILTDTYNTEPRLSRNRSSRRRTSCKCIATKQGNISHITQLTIQLITHHFHRHLQR